MATIKSFTDLQQSKKLAEILPIESADMYYEEVCNLPKAIIGNYIFHNQCMEIILNVLPNISLNLD